jgi:hypothetical protein
MNAPPSPPSPNSHAAAAAPADESEIADTLFALLAIRSSAATICPSEVARALVHDEAGWRALMPHVRRVTARLAAAGRVRVTSHGVEIDALAAHGPIRIGRVEAPGPGNDDTA